MCRVVVSRAGHEFGTVAELREVWPTLIEEDAGVLEPSDDEGYCLCRIDVPGSARVNGARVEYDDTWGEYTIVRGPGSEVEG